MLYIVLVVSFVTIVTWGLLEKALGSSTWIFTCSSTSFKLRPLLWIFAFMACRSSQIWASFKLWDIDSRYYSVMRYMLVEKDFIHIRVTSLTSIISKQPSRWLFLFTKLWFTLEFFIRMLFKYAKLISVLLRIPPFPDVSLSARHFGHLFSLFKLWWNQNRVFSVKKPRVRMTFRRSWSFNMFRSFRLWATQLFLRLVILALMLK